MLYNIEYYRRVHCLVQRYSRHYEFIIALGSALGGGAGLGILANKYMAIPCGVITATSVVLAIAKQSYDWPGRARFAVDIIDKSGKLSGKLKLLIEDICAKKEWSDEFEKLYSQIRADIANFPQDSSPQLPEKVTIEIQKAIIEREHPATWWRG
jgi:hypothetical protein